MLGILITSALTLAYGLGSILSLTRWFNNQDPTYFFELIYIFYFGAIMVFLPITVSSFVQVRRMRGYNSDQITSEKD